VKPVREIQQKIDDTLEMFIKQASQLSKKQQSK
jgi:hypothetical protein